MAVVVGGTVWNARPSARCSDVMVVLQSRLQIPTACTRACHLARGKARRSTPSLMRSARVQARSIASTAASRGFRGFRVSQHPLEPRPRLATAEAISRRCSVMMLGVQSPRAKK